MQVSIACTEHNLKSRNGEDRLLSKQSSAAPNVVNAARAKFRTVAIIARSLGTFTPQHHISLKESTAKQTGMKYRYGCPIPSARGPCSMPEQCRQLLALEKSLTICGLLNLEGSGASRIAPQEGETPQALVLCVWRVFFLNCGPFCVF